TVTRWCVRLALAYALLLQAVLGATAGTVHALAVNDALATTLCMPSGQGGDGTGDASHDLLCCTLGCVAAQPAPGIEGAMPFPQPTDERGTALAPVRHEAVAGGNLFSFEARGPPGRA